MINRQHMKIGSVKSSLANNRKRSTTTSLNRHRRMKRTQRIKMSSIMCHVKKKPQNQGSKVTEYLTVEAEETEQWQKRPWMDREE
jgi:hypothetical protein